MRISQQKLGEWGVRLEVTFLYLSANPEAALAAQCEKPVLNRHPAGKRDPLWSASWHSSERRDRLIFGLAK